MEKFTEEEFVEIREVITNQLSLYLPENSEYYDAIEELNTTEFHNLKEGVLMVISNPNCMFDNWDAKFHHVTLMLFCFLYKGDPNVTIDTDICTPTIIKLLDLMCEMKLVKLG